MKPSWGCACVNTADFLFAGSVATRQLIVRIHCKRHRNTPSLLGVRSAPNANRIRPNWARWRHYEPAMAFGLAVREERRVAFASFPGHRNIARIIVVSVRTWGGWSYVGPLSPLRGGPLSTWRRSRSYRFSGSGRYPGIGRRAPRRAYFQRGVAPAHPPSQHPRRPYRLSLK